MTIGLLLVIIIFIFVHCLLFERFRERLDWDNDFIMVGAWALTIMGWIAVGCHYTDELLWFFNIKII